MLRFSHCKVCDTQHTIAPYRKQFWRTINNKGEVQVYLSDAQISQMADAALRSYEMTSQWLDATRAAQEFAVDELHVRPQLSAVLLAVKIAKVRWIGISQGVRRKVSQ